MFEFVQISSRIFICSRVTDYNICFFVSVMNTFFSIFLQIVSRYFTLSKFETAQRFIRMSRRLRSSFIFNENCLWMGNPWLSEEFTFWSIAFIVFQITPFVYLNVFIWRLHYFFGFSMLINEVRFLLFVIDCWYTRNW